MGEDSIRTVHLKTKKIIATAAIKSQCSRDWMYGKDLLVENHFGGMEGHAQTAIDYFSRAVDPPLPDCEIKTAMLIFILMQAVRTEANIRRLESAFTEMLPHAYKGQVPWDENCKINEIDSGDRAKVILSAATTILPVLYDLSFRVLQAEACSEFVISDDPCILTNQLFHRLGGLPSLGWGMVGIQAFLPIDPRNTIMLYDRKVYKVGNRRSGFNLVLGKSDVTKLNLLQALSGMHSIYVSQLFQESDIWWLLTNATEERRSTKDEIRTFAHAGDSTLIASSQTNLNTALDWTFCKILKKSRQLREGENLRPRDRRVAELHQKLVVLQQQDEVQYAALFGDMIRYQLSRWKCY